MSNKDVLTYALQVRSVETRHTAGIRQMLGRLVWSSESDSSFLPAAVVAGQNNTIQSGVELFGLTGAGLTQGKTRPAIKTVRESFNEILTREQVLAIAGPFIKSM